MVRRLFVLLVSLSLLTAVPLAPARAQAVRVLVDGQMVAFDQPPMIIGGRVLVPLRGVFEQLGATVDWHPANNLVVAQRAGTQVQLVIGSRQAVVNGSVVMLDVPAMIVRGRTLVPLRFVSEAMGARVDWDPAASVVYVSSGTQPIPVPPVGQPVPPPAQPPAPPERLVIEGRVLRVDAAASRILVERDGAIHTFVITPNTAIIRIDVGTERGGAISLDQVRQGDFVRVAADANGRAMRIRVEVREVAGKIDAITGRSIALSDGTVFTFADDVRFAVNGREAAREQLRAGMDVTLTLNPQTRQVLTVNAQVAQAQPPQPQPPAGGVRITSFVHTATAPLRAGSSLTVTLRGSPGGTATFDIFGVASGVPMREIAPGVYQGVYAVRTQDSVADAVVVGRLRVNGQEAPLVQAGTPVTIDSLPPRIVQRFPERGTTVTNLRPNILIAFEDQGASGINPATSRLIVNGRDVTAQTSMTETAMAYNPPEPLSGRVQVRVILADKAGNVMEEAYAFSTGVPQASLIQSVTVHPTTPLRPRDVLTVRMVGTPGGQASFTIEGVEENIAMTEASDQPGNYFGTHRVRAREREAIQNARIIVRLTRGATTSQAEASARLTFVAEQVARPVITAPAAGARLGSPIVIRGTAAPGSRVEVQVDYQGSLLVFSLRGTYGQATTTADASGNWSVTFNDPIRIPNAELTITAVAIDQAGRRSEPATTKAVLAKSNGQMFALRQVRVM
ncbi:MAG: stalk domain-containing protein [Armatimonadota bacterium]